jgi:hypothetical protein
VVSLSQDDAAAHDVANVNAGLYLDRHRTHHGAVDVGAKQTKKGCAFNPKETSSWYGKSKNDHSFGGNHGFGLTPSWCWQCKKD